MLERYTYIFKEICCFKIVFKLGPEVDWDLNEDENLCDLNDSQTSLAEIFHNNNHHKCIMNLYIKSI